MFSVKGKLIPLPIAGLSGRIRMGAIFRAKLAWRYSSRYLLLQASIRAGRGPAGKPGPSVDLADSGTVCLAWTRRSLTGRVLCITQVNWSVSGYFLELTSARPALSIWVMTVLFTLGVCGSC